MRVAALIVSALLRILVMLPIFYWLMYKVLVAVNATELMWFLFWLYVPIGILTAMIAEACKKGAS